MTQTKSSRGYMLNFTGLACASALACGPSDSSDTSETNADQGSTDSTGYMMESGSDSGSDSGTDTTDTSTDTSSTTDPPECSYGGDICGEMLVCQCSCDYSSDCCSCGAVECTDDTHCADDQRCTRHSESNNYPNLLCVPDYCPSYLDAAFESGSDASCAWELNIIYTDAPQIGDFPNLRYIHEWFQVSDSTMLPDLNPLAALEHVLIIENNAALTSLNGLANLQVIEGGGRVENNPLLPTADVEALLAGVEGGDAVSVCGNLDGLTCM